MKTKRWHVHLCGPWDEGAPLRLYLLTPWGRLVVGQAIQVPDADGYYRDRWRRVAWFPNV